MNKDDVTRWAREAGFVGMDGEHGALRRLAQAAYAAGAAAEREACAKVCEEFLSMVSTGDEHMDGVLDCLSAIRARGDA